MIKLVFVFLAVPFLCFLVAMALLFLPVKRDSPEQESLDFQVIEHLSQGVNALQEMEFVARDNQALFYRYVEGDSKTAIILLHGSGADGRYLVHLATELNKTNGASVVIPDMRGHGRSQGSQSGDVDYIGQLEHDLEDLRHHLQTSTDNGTFIVAGHSSGGGLAVRYGGGRLTQFDGTLLLAPYLSHRSPTVQPNSGGWVQVVLSRYFVLGILNSFGVTTFNSREVLFFNRPEQVDDSLQVDSYSFRLNESISPLDYKAELASNAQPILLLVGSADEALNADEFEADLRPSAPNADIVIVPNAKHIDITANVDAIKRINAWLSQFIQ